MGATTVSTKCCIVGGGPAGMMLGFLLARAGINVLVLEKHGDFLRDFRGDTVHPSTLELMYELDLLDEFLKIPHQKLDKVGAQVGSEQLILGDFSKLHTKCKFIAFMPQWHFLNFLAEQAAHFPCFQLRMNTAVTGLVEESDRITGVFAKTGDGELKVNAELIIAADGRSSILRECAGLSVQNLGAPMDVLWMRLSRKDSDPPQTIGRLAAGAIFIMLNRGDYWQCGYVIPKGKIEEIKSEGIERFRKRIIDSAPFTADRVDELRSFDDIKLLTVKVDYLEQWWRNGLLCIGDAAHAMSPVGGVGINLAIQDAVAAANILYKPLRHGYCTTRDLRAVQQRRMYPTRMTQRLQVFLQENVIAKTLAAESLELPWFVRLLSKFPTLRAVPAQLLGIGFRPEHVHSPNFKGLRIRT